MANDICYEIETRQLEDGFWEARGKALGKVFATAQKEKEKAVEFALNTLCAIEEYGNDCLNEAGDVDAGKVMQLDIEKKRKESNWCTIKHRDKFTVKN